DSLFIMGHGSPGNISVGDGKSHVKGKRIDGSPSEWWDELDTLKGKFCDGATVFLLGCNVGACSLGAAKLKELADSLGVTVKGAVDIMIAGKNWKYLESGRFQEADPDSAQPACSTAVVKKAKKECTKKGDAGLYNDFGENERDVIAGLTLEYSISPTNFGFVSETCPETDTFCLHIEASREWTITCDPPMGKCHIVDPGYLWWQDITITVPCDVYVGEINTIVATMSYCSGDEPACEPLCGDCEDPNWYGGVPYYSRDTLILYVQESPSQFEIDCPESTMVGAGQTAAYIPFQICNTDPCAPPSGFGYCISSNGVPGDPPTPPWNIPPIYQCDTVIVPGGECGDVFGIIDAGNAVEGDRDTLEIMAWSVDDPTITAAATQIVYVEEGTVPLSTAPMVTVLVLAAIAAAAFLMRKRAASRA
ncbi:MAG: DUF4347 domain-containing protein, partial [Candidatus Krumholzibacteria bacterium]|nr:DUF4347 domain-containing protein [Candidatus Krumholzibacteria bacterium]